MEQSVEVQLLSLTLMLKKIIIGLLVLGAVYLAYQKLRPRSIAEKYELAPVVREDIRQTVIASGKIKSKSQLNLKFQTAGLLAWDGVQEGDSVKKWQALASLDKRELAKTLKKYLLDFSKERNDFDEDLKLTYRDKALTDTISRLLQKNQYDLDKAVLDVEIQDIAVKLATIVSPIAGIVTRVDVPVAGVNIIPAGAVFTVADPDHLLFEAEVDETDVGRLAVGQPVELRLDAFPDQPIKTTVERVDFNATIDASGATIYQVEFSLEPNAQFRLGLNGEVTITTAEKSGALTVPFSSVDTNNQVQVVRDGRLETVPVVSGIDSQDKLEIVSGLNEGDQAVL